MAGSYLSIDFFFPPSQLLLPPRAENGSQDRSNSSKRLGRENLGSRHGLVEIIDVAAVVEFLDETIVDKVFRFGALRFGIFFRQ